ncbi:nucleotide-binding universal stress UspA family protein [Luteibacter sp. 1214]|mgnify:CR=1 FL=1|uniref:universal stress protein n=1 Tax=Luteibacter sp. 1214 TaxID=2817735 RepID=UPI00285B62EC|nr:universal stress protein [Luteibacter sp. 1214]MDR6642033.1 nucleotide-binding universal stress UspA family protein [Luteibacter sp. 1214]
MPKNILVGYDGSETARRAYLFAIELAACAQASVHVVSVWQLDNGADTSALMMSDNGKDRLDALRAEIAALQSAPGIQVEVGMVHGSPGDALLSYVAQHGVDHIVIGHTERGALARWLVGSTSTDVLAKAHVPVTVVR